VARARTADALSLCDEPKHAGLARRGALYGAMGDFRRLAFTVTILVACHGACEAAASIDAASSDFVSRLNGAITSLVGKTGKDAYASCVSYVDSLLDLDVIARKSAAAVWDRMTAKQQSAYRAALERRAAKNCVNENGNNSGKPAAILGIRASGADRLLATRSEQKNGEPGRTVVWRLPASDVPEGVRAIDVLVDGRSTVLSLRDEAKGILDDNKGDINTMITGIGR
jgi:hypothetical protein